MPRQKLIPSNSSVHYLRGQILQRLGRNQEARAEMEATTRLMNEQRDKRQKELYGGPAPNPELTQEPQLAQNSVGASVPLVRFE